MPEAAVLMKLVTVIRRDDEQGLLRDVELHQVIPESTNHTVDVLDAFVVERGHVLEIHFLEVGRQPINIAIVPPSINELFGGDPRLRVRGMNVHEVKVEKKRIVSIRSIWRLEPRNCTLDEIVAVANILFRRTQVHTVVEEIVVEPLSEPELRLKPGVADRSSRAVAQLPEPLGQQCMGLIELWSRFLPVVLSIEGMKLSEILHAGLRRIEAREQRGRGRNGLRDSAHHVLEENAVGHQRIQTRARRSRITERAQVIPAERVHNDEDNVGAWTGRLTVTEASGASGEYQDRQQQTHGNAS